MREELLEAVEIITGSMPEGEEDMMYAMLLILAMQGYLRFMSEQENKELLEMTAIDFALLLLKVS